MRQRRFVFAAAVAVLACAQSLWAVGVGDKPQLQFKAFGTNLLVIRYLMAALRGLTALLLYSLTRRVAPGPVAWMPFFMNGVTWLPGGRSAVRAARARTTSAICSRNRAAMRRCSAVVGAIRG